jgi:hypothetical protein
MDPAETQEATETLEQLKKRLARDVADMVKVLTADAPVFLKRPVRTVFERSDAADALDDAAVSALKAATDEASAHVEEELREALSLFDIWTWDETPVPTNPTGLDAHPRVAPVLAKVGEAVAKVLDAHGLSPQAEITYQLPTYFVAGHFMKSLVADYWRVLADFHSLSVRLEEESQSDQRETRRARWDSA